jgi:hypothetical protein
MKRIVVWFLLVGCGSVAGGVAAQDFPSQQAARLGYKEYEKICAVIGPLVNHSYPKKDYRALMAASGDIQNAVLSLSDIQFKTHNNFKFSAFKNGLAKLTQTVADYASAAQAENSDSVYILFPLLHEQIDQTANALLPVPWREFEKLQILAANLAGAVINEEDDKTPFLAKVDKIQDAVNEFVASTVPKEVQYRAKLIGEERAYFVKLVTRMKESLDKSDMLKFRDQATELNVRLGTFTRMYLQ